ncbi:DgyrCDS2994 [Dimorphilus gyrociliatus]|uniref:Iron-sulfur cluster assembly 2 homolog, mitochondrial n=1 Tax=Dimorphilus gyrociliatus TaxID=2664684 RepID=A0A7I8VDS3_9ANNE|nr:DgyrCDS2994 [Dimorphilus gyrociliatus]
MASMFRNIAHIYRKLPSQANNCHRFSTASNEKTSLNEPDDNTIHLSDACVERMQAIASKGEYLRVIIEGGGCSGFQYKFNLDTVLNEDDKVFSNRGVSIVVDSESFDFIKGSTIDFQVELIRSSFVIMNNPNAEQGCSCGASFNLKF